MLVFRYCLLDFTSTITIVQNWREVSFPILSKYLDNTIFNSIWIILNHQQNSLKNISGNKFVKKTLFDFEQHQWSLRINANDDCFRFRLLHNKLLPGSVWLTALQYPSSLESMTFLAKLCCLPKSDEIKNCMICELQFTITTGSDHVIKW